MTRDYETEMREMLKEPLGNVRVWHPSLDPWSGANILEIAKLRGISDVIDSIQYRRPNLLDLHSEYSQITDSIKSRGKA